MKTLLLLLLVTLGGLAAGAHAQVSSPTYPAVTVSGSTIAVANPYGATTTSWEEIPTGTPATVSVTIQGCMRGGTCDATQDTNAATTAVIRGVTFTKVYGYFLVTVNFTGGTSPTMTINPFLVH